MTALLPGMLMSDRLMTPDEWGVGLIWLHAAADALTAGAVALVAAALWRRSRDGGTIAAVALRPLGLALVACAGVCLMDLWSLAVPVYGLEGLIKAAAAVLAIVAAATLWRAAPPAGEVVERGQRQAAEAALGASERRFREFAEIASDWLWEMDAELRFTYVSQRAAEISGVPTEQTLGRTREDVADTTEDPEGFRRHLEDLKARRPFRDFVFARRAGSSGDLRYARVSGKPIFDDGGAFRGYRGVASDVTDQIRAERRATQAHARLIDAIEALPGGFMLFDKDEKLVLANSKHAQMFPEVAQLVRPGTSFEAFLDLTVEKGLAVGAREDGAAWKRWRMAQFRKGDTNVEIPWSDGRWFDVFERRTSEGGLVTIRLEITERKNAEARAEQAHRRLMDAIESLPAGFMLFDKDERLVLANRYHLEMYKAFGDVTAIGTPFESMVRQMAHKGLREDARRDPEGYVQKRMAQFRSGGFEGEVRFVDGRWFHHIERRTSEGGIVSIRMDITARKRAEEGLRESERLFRAIVDNAPMVIFLKDLEGRYLLINRAFEQWSNISAAEAHGKTAYDLYPRDFADSLTRQDRLVIESNAILTEEIDLPHSDGVVHHIMGTKFPITDADGAVTQIGGFNVDLTRIKTIEEQLRQAQKMEAVGQLTGGIAHDFNNLLTVVLGNLDEIVERLPADDAMRPIAEQAVSAAERGATLTQKLLAFARRQPLRPKAFDCNEVVQGMADLLRRTLGEHIEVRTELGRDLPAALADRGQVENALLNLAINARDAMEEGGRVLIETGLVHLDPGYVAANPDVKPGSYLMLAVTDTGEGMTPEVRARAFEPFFTTKEVGKGSGMGLSMIYGFAKQSGGHVKLYSEVGQGTTVRLYLPAASEAMPASASGAVAGGSTRARAGETVLVVEDDELVRGTVVRLLSELGYRVLEAMDMASAMAVLDAKERIDLLFTDVVLPGKAGGRQLAEEAARRRPGLKVLFTSGYTQNSIVHHGRLDAGVQLLSKPYKKEMLAATVRRVIDGAD